MWEIENSHQTFSFAVCLLLGVIYCLLYDLLRAVRKIKPKNDAGVFLQDICYFILIAFLTFIIFVPLSNGEIRGYLLLAITIGFTVCYLTLSRLVVKFFTFLFSLIYNLSEKTIEHINRFFDFITLFTVKNLKNCYIKLNNIKKILKNHLKKKG